MSNSAFQPTVLTVPSGTTGSGQGELNLITNPVSASNLDGWFTGSVGRGTSGGPLNPSIGTYFTVAAANSGAGNTESSTTGAYSVLSLPSGLQNKKLKVEFYFTSFTDVYYVSVYKGTTRVPLTTDVSGVGTALPISTTGKFVAYFDTDSSGTWSVNITRKTGTGSVLQFTNVVVGPGIQPQGAVVGEWTSFTPSSSQGFGTLSSISFFYKREGSDILIRGAVQTGTSTATAAYLGLPAGLTTSGGLGGANRAAGTWQIDNSTASTRKSGVILSAPNSTVFYFTSDDYTAASGPFSGLNGSSVTAGTASTTLEVDCRIPIAEWAGSGTVQLAQNDVEYAWNSGNVTGAGLSDNTSFAYGPSGTPILAYNSTTLTGTSQTSFLVQFQTPIQAGDKLTIEIGNATTGWTDFSSFQGVFTGQAAAVYGCQVIAISRTQARVYFGNAGQWSSGATYASAGAPWSGLSAYNWRVRKSSAGAAVGFGIVQPGVSSGLVSAAGLPGNTTGSDIATGYVGEIVSATLTDVPLTSATAANGGTLVLQPGIWTVYYKGTVDAGAFSTYTSTFCSISVTSASHDTTNRVLEFSTYTAAEHSPGTCVKTIKVTTANYPVYGVITGTFSATSPVSKASKSQLYAVRIA